MAEKTVLGDACAHCRDERGSRYVKIGTVFAEPDLNGGDVRLMLKIDALPVASAGWTGWINVFKRKESNHE